MFEKPDLFKMVATSLENGQNDPRVKWHDSARPDQRQLPGNWSTWLVRGGRGCITGDTRIYDPSTGTETAVRDIHGPHTVLSVYGPARASEPFIKGTADIYKVVLADGRSV